MNEQERYRSVVMTYFHYSYRIPFDSYVAEIIERFRQAGMVNTDVPDALYHALSNRAWEVERKTCKDTEPVKEMADDPR